MSLVLIGFFFPAGYEQLVPRTRFVIGQPFWGLFFPLWASRANLTTSLCYSPVALHKSHDIAWDREFWWRFGIHMFELFAPELARLLFASIDCKKYLDRLLGSLAFTSNSAIMAGAQPFFCPSREYSRVLAPVDPLYWARATEETFIHWDRTFCNDQ
jgi:hypothetical protein